MSHNYKYKKKKKYDRKKEDTVTLEPKKDDKSTSVDDLLDKIDSNVAKNVAKRFIERTKVVTKEQRHQIEERAEDGYDFDTKQRALRRSNDRCCHCGKQIFVGYGMTLDHFVPLHKGGTNDDVNLIALCDKCNKTKDNYIVAPSAYLPYLKKEERIALTKYFLDYVNKYECINRNSLLSYDRYDIWLGVAGNNHNHNYEPTEKNRSAVRKFSKQLAIIHYLGKSKEEYDELLEYYIGYLKKRKLYENYSKAKGQLDKWIEEKCIYYIKDQSGIVFMSVLWASKLTNKGERINNRMGLNLLMLAKYNTDSALTIYYNFISDIIYYVRRENKLSRLHLRIICSLEDRCGMYYALYYHPPGTSVKEQSPDFGTGTFNCTYDTVVYSMLSDDEEENYLISDEVRPQVNHSIERALRDIKEQIDTYSKEREAVYTIAREILKQEKGKDYSDDEITEMVKKGEIFNRVKMEREIEDKNYDLYFLKATRRAKTPILSY